MLAWATKGVWGTADTVNGTERRLVDWFRVGFEPLFADFTQSGSWFAVYSLLEVGAQPRLEQLFRHFDGGDGACRKVFCFLISAGALFVCPAAVSPAVALLRLLRLFLLREPLMPHALAFLWCAPCNPSSIRFHHPPHSRTPLHASEFSSTATVSGSSWPFWCRIQWRSFSCCAKSRSPTGETASYMPSLLLKGLLLSRSQSEVI